MTTQHVFTTTQHVVMTTEHQEVTNEVKGLTTKTLFQSNKSRISRYQQRPMTTAIRINRSIASLDLPRQVPALMTFAAAVDMTTHMEAMNATALKTRARRGVAGGALRVAQVSKTAQIETSIGRCLAPQ